MNSCPSHKSFVFYSLSQLQQALPCPANEWLCCPFQRCKLRFIEDVGMRWASCLFCSSYCFPPSAPSSEGLPHAPCCPSLPQEYWRGLWRRACKLLPTPFVSAALTVLFSCISSHLNFSNLLKVLADFLPAYMVPKQVLASLPCLLQGSCLQISRLVGWPETSALRGSNSCI